MPTNRVALTTRVYRPSVRLRGFCLLITLLAITQLFYLGSQPFAAGLFNEPWDKLAHLVAYGSITLMLWIVSAGRKPLAIIALVAVLGLLDELHQFSLPGRSASGTDLLTDIAAASIVIAMLQIGHKANRFS